MSLSEIAQFDRDILSKKHLRSRLNVLGLLSSHLAPAIEEMSRSHEPRTCTSKVFLDNPSLRGVLHITGCISFSWHLVLRLDSNSSF